ncbi:MAG: trigger factor [Phycisphaeraceae bacterium]|nr:trigger factor [Phycisphaeraceae bacterium]MCW5762345.1 trigger factor [Phycisphaeraceae bacterium]
MAEATIETKVQVEDAGPCRKKLTIEIPADVVTEKLTDALDTLAVEAAMPGFRKGHAPKRLIEKRFGETVRHEAKNQLIATAFQQALDEHKLKIVGEPFSDSMDKVVVESGKPLVFEVSVEVMPEFELPKLDGLKVRKPIPEVSEAMVDGEIQKILINEGELQERETAEAGDYLTGHGVMKAGDQEIHNIEGAVVQVPTADKQGKGMILGVMVEDFAKQLGLPKPGETVTVRAKGPENHEIEDVRGKDLTITFRVDRVDRIIAASKEDVVSRYGLSNVDQLHDMVKSKLNERALVNQATVMRQQVARHLMTNTTFDLPERLTAVQSLRLLERRRMELMYRGVQPLQIEEHIAELRAASAEAAARELKLFFILSKVGDDLDVRVEESEINGRIARLAMERGERPEKMRQELIRSRQVGVIYQQIREHKTLDAILAKAEFEEMSAEDFNAAMKAEMSGAV